MKSSHRRLFFLLVSAVLRAPSWTLTRPGTDPLHCVSVSRSVRSIGNVSRIAEKSKRRPLCFLWISLHLQFRSSTVKSVQRATCALGTPSRTAKSTGISFGEAVEGIKKERKEKKKNKEKGNRFVVPRSYLIPPLALVLGSRPFAPNGCEAKRPRNTENRMEE